MKPALAYTPGRSPLHRASARAAVAYLGALAVGRVAEFVEPSGNVRFTAVETDLPGPVLRVTARRL